MRRDIEAARAAAEALVGDLSSTLFGTWEIEVDDAFVLTVVGNGRTERVALAESVDVDLWPAEMLVPGSPEVREVLLADAAEAVAYDVIEVVQMWGEHWPTCPQHGSDMDPCGDVWVCQSDVEHEMVFGQLRK